MFIEKIILDTDIGEDVDDVWALALALKSHGFDADLLGVTTTYRNVREKAIFARKIINSSQREVPVYYGIERTTEPAQGYITPWDYDLLSPEEFQQTDSEANINPGAVEFIVDAILKNPGEVNLIGIGPSTNIAEAISRLEDLKLIKKIYLMAGCISNEYERVWKKPEYNLRKDIDAFNTIVASEVPMVVVGKDSGVVYTREEIGLLGELGAGELGNLVHRLTKKYLDFVGEETKMMWDPLTVGVLLMAEFYFTRPIEPIVTKKGQMYGNVTLPRLSCIDGVFDIDNHDRLKQEIFKRITYPL